jgi:hypothetical protein
MEIDSGRSNGDGSSGGGGIDRQIMIFEVTFS